MSRIINSLIEYLDTMGVMMGGIFISKIRELGLSFIVGLFLIIWYAIDILQRSKLIFGLQDAQFDLQNFYIIVDVLSVYYLVYLKITTDMRNIFHRIFWSFLLCWFFFFTIVDIAVVPLNQPNTFSFNALGLFIDASILTLILKNEIKKNEDSLKKFLS